MFRRIGVLVFAFSCLALGQPAAGFPDGIDWRFAHPNADLRMSVNVQDLLKSPAVSAAIQQIEANSEPKQAAQIEYVLGMLSAVDRISFSLVQTYGGGSDTLILVKGRFPKGVEGVLSGKGNNEVQRLDENTILIGQSTLGDSSSFKDAVHRMNMIGDPKSLHRDELEQSDLWIGGGDRLLSQYSANAPPPFRSVRSLSLGLNLRETPELSLILSTSGPQGAKQVLDGLQAFTAQTAAMSPQAAAMLQEALHLQQDGSRVRLHYAVSPELLKAIEAQAGSGGSTQLTLSPLLKFLGVGAAGGTASPAASSVPSPDTHGKIIIYGLDGG
ncbi:MAG TPA: hypothetical protein VFW83_06820, partial [Bryobacteraceae bacterium]|nr:hypothetical protein [Bryobacteraceae bacterium]